MRSELEQLWAAIARAAAALDDALPAPLDATVSAALEALSRVPFEALIRQELGDA